jgi:D-threo-aldose 1-dehydrogenase
MGDLTAPRAVGRTALRVPAIGLGTAPMGGLYAPVPESQAVETIHYALAHEVRFFDTAPLYGAGQSERYLGTALAGVPRDQYVLATKVGRLIHADGTVEFDFSRDGVLRSVEESLRRLRLDHIDIIHIHDPDDLKHYGTVLHEAFPALAELRTQGVIKAIGAGMNQWELLADFARAADFDCFLLAGRYTLLQQHPLHEFLPLCQSRGISVFLGGVYNSGILASGAQPGAKYMYADAPPQVLERVRRIEAVCARHAVPLYVAAAQFPLAHPAVTTLLFGARYPTELEATIDALRQPIPPGLWDDLRADGLLDPAAPTPAP